MNAIEVRELHKVYQSAQGPVQALNGISFTVPKGCIFGILGPNGAGKTTLVKILTTITTPSRGQATVAGFDLLREPLKVRSHIAVVLQQAAVETLLNVRDNLLVYAHMHGMERGEALNRLAEVVEEFELKDRLGETVQDLSIGTKRRVQVAKIFMLDSPIIFLDEATTGMDPFMKRRVLDRIRKEAHKGRTVLLTTQILSEAEELCDTIMIINHGTTLAAGTLQDLRQLSQQMFRVKLSFVKIEDVVRRKLAELGPDDLKIEGATVEMLFKSQNKSALLVKLAQIAEVSTITQCEIRGADLEEIFLTLVKTESIKGKK